MEEAGGGNGEKNNFARKLGSTDKKTREKGLSLLVLWLSCQQVSSGVSFRIAFHKDSYSTMGTREIKDS